MMIEGAIRTRAAAVGLVPDLVLDLVEVTYPMLSSPLCIPDAIGLEIDRAVRDLALDRPELVRDPAALKLAPREAYDHLMKLISGGRRADAEAFNGRHADAIAVGKSAAAREAEQARTAQAQREARVTRLNEQIALKSHAYREIKKDIAHAEKWGEHRNDTGSWVHPGPATKASIERLKEHEARIGGELVELQRELETAAS